MPYIGSGDDVQWVDDATYASLARPDLTLPAGVEYYTIPGTGFEGQGMEQGIRINGVDVGDIATTFQPGTYVVDGNPGGTIVNPFTGQTEQAYSSALLRGMVGNSILPKSLALQLDPNAAPYQNFPDGGYGGFGGFLEQMMVPALMAGVGAAGFSGLGGAGAGSFVGDLGTAAFPLDAATIGGMNGVGGAASAAAGGGMDFLSEIAGNYGNAQPGMFDGGYDFLSEIAGNYGNAQPGTFDPNYDFLSEIAGNYGNAQPGTFGPSGIESLIQKLGPTAAKAAITAAGGDGSIIDKILSNPSLLGAGLGGLAGLLGGSRQAGTITSVTDIPDWLKPYAADLLNRSRGQLDSTLANPSGVNQAGTSEYLKTLSGQYLDPASNPWLSKTFDMAADKVSGRVAGDFNKYNRLGSGAHQGVLGSNLNDLATSIYGGNYQQERSRQAAAAGGAPAFESARVGAGFAPFSNYGNLFGGILGRTSSKSEPYFDNPMGNVMSGILGGSQLGKMFS